MTPSDYPGAKSRQAAGLASAAMPYPLLRPWITRNIYQCLTLGADRAAQLRPEAPAIEAPVEVRPVARRELAALSAERRYEISGKFLAGIGRRADTCLGAFVDGELASYAFVAVDSPTAIDGKLCFRFPAGWLYIYKVFTLPKWRGRRLAPLLLQSGLPSIERWLPYARAPAGFVTLALSHNRASLHAFARCGFAPTLEFPVWRILSQAWPAASARANRCSFSLGNGSPVPRC